MTGKKVTADDIFGRAAEERRRDAFSPEGEARFVRSSEKFAREEAARMEWEAKNPPTPEQMGAEAASSGDEFEPPEDMSEDDQDRWRQGYLDRADPYSEDE